MCAFYTYSSAADFSPIDVVIDSDGFIIPAKSRWRISMTLQFGGGGGGGGDLKVPGLHLRKRRRAAAGVISIIFQRKRQAELLCCASFTSKLHI